jgi:competence ComEA-like helix-hairpin-helix protein
MENLTLGSVRLYLVRPGSFAPVVSETKDLSLCVVHGGNSFLLSRGLSAGNARPAAPLSIPDANASALLFQGVSAPLKAVGSPYGAGDAIVLESNGRGIGVRSLRQISITLTGGGETGNAGIPASTGAVSKGQPKAEAPAGKININTASAAELEALSGIGAKKAGMIVQFREANGAFAGIEDIKKVPGIGEKLFQRNKERLSVN